MLPELRSAAPAPNALQKEYSSADHVLDLAGTAALLRRNDLLEEGAAGKPAAELLR